jgi:hypothetical protein
MSRLMMSKSRRSMPLLDRRTGCINVAVLLRAPPIRIPSVFRPVLCGRILGAIRTLAFASRCDAIINVTTHPSAGIDRRAAYVVRDANGQALAYIYSRDNEAEALQAVLTPRQLVSRQGAPKGLRPIVVPS